MGSTRSRRSSIGEEIANSITHGIGWALSLAALVLLVVFSSKHGDAWLIVSCSVYGVGLVLLYTNSTMYHAIQARTAKKVFRILDHSSIFFLIAATYTPFTLTLLRGIWGWILFGIVWSGFIIGTLLKVFFAGKYKWLSVSIYIMLGWCLLLAIGPVIENLALPGLILLAGGGVSYSIGALIYMKKGVRYSHTVWHIYVLIGSMMQFFSIFFYVILSE
ncbi:MAG: hemolysin III family protein [Candidatus Thermoplasmatota archaeon]|nr:hemolysin III family protein [Candidatus Thermoplasmatota archaeon]